MQINNCLTKLIFYFLVLGLTGCSGFTKTHLSCPSPEPRQVVATKQEPMRTQTQQHPDGSVVCPPSNHINNDSNALEWFKNVFLAGTLDRSLAKSIEDIWGYFVELRPDQSISIPDYCSDSSDYMPQMMADLILYMAYPVVKTVCKRQATNLRKLVCKCLFKPDFIKRLVADCQAISNGSDAGAAMHNNFNFIAYSTQAHLANFDSYIAGLCLHFAMYIFDFQLNMPIVLPNCSSDAIHQIMAGCILYIAHIVFKAVLKQKVANYRQLFLNYLSHPDSISSLITNLKGISNGAYAHVTSSARFVASIATFIGKPAFSSMVPSVNRGTLWVSGVEAHY